MELKLIHAYPEVCQGSLGKMPEKYSTYCCKINSEPEIHSPRRILFSMMPKLKETLSNLTKGEIIKPVNKPVELVRNLLVVKKKGDTLKLCSGSFDFNKAIVRASLQLKKL